MANGDESSSEEDTYQDFTGHINVPNINLSQIRKKQTKTSSRDNFVKVGKRFTPKKKSVRFPDSSRSRDAVIHEDSTTNNSSESEDSVSEAGNDSFRQDSNLPSFRFDSQQQTQRKDNEDEESEDDDDDDVDDDEAEYEYRDSQPLLDGSSTSDGESEEEEPQPSNYVGHKDNISPVRSNQESRPSPQISKINSVRSNISNVSRHSRNSLFGFIHGETDITDQKKRSDSVSELSGSSDPNKQGFKGILKKLALADQEYSDPRYYHEAEISGSAKADSFIGRVLNMTNSGLSGGGMTPGASRLSRERTIDEEEEIGMEDSNSIEMKRLDFTHASEEAKNLILSHVPEAAKMLNTSSFDQHLETALERPTGEGQTAFRIDKEREKSEGTTNLDSYPPSEVDNTTDHEDEFYQPNPNLDSGILVSQPEDYTMMLDEDMHDDYVAPPKKLQAGVLSSLLKLYQNPQANKSTGSSLSSAYDIETRRSEDDHQSVSTKVPTEFKKLGKGVVKGGQFISGQLTGHLGNGLKNKRISSNSKRELSSSASFSSDEYDEKTGSSKHDTNLDVEGLPSFQQAKPKTPKKSNPINNTINTINPTKVPQMRKKIRKHRREQAERLRITVHIADVLQRQKFIMRMCRALMLFGAPTHRLEEYMTMTSRVLEIDGQFLYLPGCMIVSFGDAATRTSEVHLVKCVQGVNLSKLSDTHTIYKSVIHDLVGVEEAASKLEDLLRKKNFYSPWICVFLYGLGSASVCPFAFSGNWYDIPISFGIGLCVGYLQYFLSSMSNLYSSVFEVTSSIVVSFIARAIGSIRGGKIFCFGAIAQGSLALILPGYIILCGSLELQSKNLVAGSVRMFYAIIYSLFLGFGITLGAALYGWVDKNSTNQAQCAPDHKIDDKWRILFVPLYSICLGLINQARWRQLPVMVAISGTGYVGNYFAGKHFSTVTEFTAAIGAFIIGILGNMYSRIGKGMAVSAMLPAIFVQVPSGIASKSTLLSGISSANQITHSSSSAQSSNNDVDSLSFGATMVEVSIGISVGLFAAALVVYPFGKKRTGLFTL